MLFLMKAIPKLTSTLWGEFYMNPMTKIISRKPPTNSAKPMVVQLIFEQLWKVIITIAFKRYKSDLLETFNTLASVK